MALALTPAADPCALRAASQPETLRVGIYDNPPKIFRDAEGRPAGFWPEVVEGVAAEIGFTPVYVPCGWAECLKMLEAGRIDMMPDVAISRERAERFRFGLHPVLYAWSRVLAPARSDIERLAQLDGRTVAVVADSVQGRALSALHAAGDLRARVLHVEGMQAAADAVAAGRADAAITNRLFAERAAQAEGFRLMASPFGGSALHFAFSPRVAEGLIEQVDLAVYRLTLQEDSVLNLARERWIEGRGATLPSWVAPLLGGLAAALALAGAMALILRRMVRLRTAELRATVAELEAALEAQRRAEAAAVARRRNEAVGRLVGGAAHDFNNLLTVMRTSLEMLLSRAERPQDRAQLNDALAAEARGEVLVRQLLGASRRASLRPQRIDVQVQLRQIAELLARVFPPSIAVETRAAPGTPAIRVDPGRFEDALLNLALNARDAMPGGGRIEISARRASEPPADAEAGPAPPDASGAEDAVGEGPAPVPVPGPEGFEPAAPPIRAAAGGYVAIDFVDDGAGMDEATRRRVFEPFFTTKPSGQGTGMGLASIHGFVAQSGGAIRVRSRLGEGTAFTLFFPAAP